MTTSTKAKSKETNDSQTSDDTIVRAVESIPLSSPSPRLHTARIQQAQLRTDAEKICLELDSIDNDRRKLDASDSSFIAKAIGDRMSAAVIKSNKQTAIAARLDLFYRELDALPAAIDIAAKVKAAAAQSVTESTAEIERTKERTIKRLTDAGITKETMPMYAGRIDGAVNLQWDQTIKNHADMKAAAQVKADAEKFFHDAAQFVQTSQARQVTVTAAVTALIESL